MRREDRLVARRPCAKSHSLAFALAATLYSREPRGAGDYHGQHFLGV